VLDGEIVCLASDGRSLFTRLLFRRDWPHFVAFDVLSIDGEDLRARPLVQRKRRPRGIVPRIETRLVYTQQQRANVLWALMIGLASPMPVSWNQITPG
jgi:bifunctional non-homologous end joining protein LigD